MRTRFTIPKEATALQILAAIDSWAARRAELDGAKHYVDPSNETTKLWHVLTALRGPDCGSYAMKLRTTAVIRRHALPILTAQCGGVLACRDAKLPDQFDDTHFENHIRLAARVVTGEK